MAHVERAPGAGKIGGSNTEGLCVPEDTVGGGGSRAFGSDGSEARAGSAAGAADAGAAGTGISAPCSRVPCW